MTIEQRISAAVDEIVAATDPEQVVLFGSLAKGTAGPESDIDLLIVDQDLTPTQARNLGEIEVGAAVDRVA